MKKVLFSTLAIVLVASSFCFAQSAAKPADKLKAVSQSEIVKDPVATTPALVGEAETGKPSLKTSEPQAKRQPKSQFSESLKPKGSRE